MVDPEKQPISQLYRYQVDSVTGRVTSKLLTPRAMEFPAINPDFTGGSCPAAKNKSPSVWEGFEAMDCFSSSLISKAIFPCHDQSFHGQLQAWS